jgi:tetratricopeptide (TPR) repeat protein
VADHLREARRTFEDVTRTGRRGDGDLAEAYGSLGRVLHVYEFFDAAEAAYANAVRLRPDDFRWLHLLGYLYQQTGRLEASADRLLAARRVQPDDRAATVRLGGVYLGLNRLRDAREQFQSVLETFPASARSGLGEVALREGRFEEAIAHFRAALDRVPQATALHYSLAMAYRGLGRLDEARSYLQQRGSGGITAVDRLVDDLQTLVRGEGLLVIQGRRAYEAGLFQEAADAFSRAIGVASGSVPARVNLGLALLQLGDTAGAVQQFEAALVLESDNVVAHASLGMLLARQGRDAEAVEHLRVAFERAPDDANVRGGLITSLARLNRERDVIEVLTRVRGLDPDDEDALVTLSILLASQERYRDAVALLEDGHRRHPDRAPTATTLARLLASSPDLSLRDGRRAFGLAMVVYQASSTPGNAETVGLALAEMGRCPEAAEWMRRAVAEAERASDSAEAARLRIGVPQYETTACRASGR